MTAQQTPDALDVEWVEIVLSSNATPEEILAFANREVERARRRLALVVERLRADGQSWAAIGRALGITRQAAWERFTKPRRGVAA